MAKLELVPNWFWRTPELDLSSLLEENDGMLLPATNISGLTVYEDEKNVYVEAALPGVDPKDVDVTYDKGVVWIKAEKKEEEKGKKFYRRATSSFSYQTTVPGEVNPDVEPEAVQKNGVLKLSFTKVKGVEPRKIKVKAN